MEGERHVNKLKIKWMGTVIEVYTQYASRAQRRSGYFYLETRERKDSKMTLGRWQLFFCFCFLIYLFLAVLGLCFCARAFSSCSERGPLFIAVRGPLTIAASLVGSTGSRRAGSVVVVHGPSCSVACGIFPDQGSNPCPLHWQADSQPLRHQGRPGGNSWTQFLGTKTALQCQLFLVFYSFA